MTVTLEVLNTESNIRRVVITRTAVIGRGQECGLRIASGRVSRRHCELILGDDGVRIRDLGSSNGTFVNNEPLVPGVIFELDPDDEVRLGSVRLRARFEPIVVERPVLPREDEDPTTGADSASSGGLAAAIAEASEAVTMAADEPIGEQPVEDVLVEDAVEDADAVGDAAEGSHDDSLPGPDSDLSLDDEDPSFLDDDVETAETAAGDQKQQEPVTSDATDDSAILDFLNNLD